MGRWGGWEFWRFWVCLGFIGERRDTKKTNVVTQNTSGKEVDAAEIIADAGSH